jgi:cyclopropane-fatty-acyl-phospholipid synthase
MNADKLIIEKMLSGAGITINGSESYDIQIANPKFFNRVLRDGSIGLGESYMEGWWDCQALDEFFFRLFSKQTEKEFLSHFLLRVHILKARLFNLQTKSKALSAIASHYDIGNDLFSKMLDPLMMYSCGYWHGVTTLKEAQEQKLKLICEKMHLQAGQTVLDIGCGWGGFAYYAAKNYHVKVVGITLSKEQQEIAIKRCSGLDVEIRFQDYRDVKEPFDRIVSIGMLEHVGYKNYKAFMEVVSRNLSDEGICLLHFIAGNETELAIDPWIHKYIFPNGVIPSMAQIGKSMEKQLVFEDLQNIGLHYDYTLMAWRQNFVQSWETLQENYSEIFYRMWNYYLSCSAASFRSRRLNLWQIIVRKPGSIGAYTAVRFEC